MKSIAYFLIILFSCSVFAEYFKLTPEDCPDTTFRFFESTTYFTNRTLDSRVREIRISKNPDFAHALRMDVVFDGLERRQNAEELARIFESEGINLSEYGRIDNDYGQNPRIKVLHLKYISSDEKDVYKRALNKIHEFEAIEPAGMIDSIKAEIDRLAIVADEHSRSQVRQPVALAFDLAPGLYGPLAIGSFETFQPIFDFPSIQPTQNLDPDPLMERLWNQHVDSRIPRKDETKQLNNKHYKVIIEPSGEGCSICLIRINEMVQLNCSGKHVFCRGCIEESYKYQQICPNCRGPILEKD